VGGKSANKIDTINQSLGFIGEVSGPRLPKAGKGWVMAQAALTAYLDPGSGSMVMQLVVGGIAGLGVLLRYYGTAIWSFFKDKT
jgi:hypothetical protein